MGVEGADLGTVQHPRVDPQVIQSPRVASPEAASPDLDRGPRIRRSGEVVFYHFRINPIAVKEYPDSGSVTGPVVGDRHVVGGIYPALVAQRVRRFDCDGAPGCRGQPNGEFVLPPKRVGDRHRSAQRERQPPLSVGPVHLVQQGLFDQSRVAHPEGQGEWIRHIDGTRPGECDVGVDVERRALPGVCRPEERFAAHHAAVPVVARGVGEATLHFVVRFEPRAAGSRDGLDRGLLPLSYLPPNALGRQVGLHGPNPSIDCVELLPLLRIGQLQHRDGIPVDPVQPEFIHRVEERVELVELTLGDRVILVVVAPGAAHCHRHPDGGDGLHAVHHVLRVVLGRDRSALMVNHVVAVESGSDPLVRVAVWQEVARQLLNGELVEGLVVVECPNHPVSPVPHVTSAVDVKPVRVCVARQVEPLHGHLLAIVRRAQQPVHLTLVCVR